VGSRRDALCRKELDHLRQVIGLRGYGQRDPLNEYKAEAFSLFEAMIAHLREAVTAQLMRVEIVPPEQEQPQLPEMEAHKLNPDTGEDEFAFANMALAQGRPQRKLSVRFGQEVQALSRTVRVRRSPASTEWRQVWKIPQAKAAGFFFATRRACL